MFKKEELRKANKFLGLMFRTRKTNPILLEFDEDTNIPIHSYFVFFPFKAIWLDKNNKVIDKRIVRPFTFSVKAKKPFRKIIEIPL